MPLKSSETRGSNFFEITFFVCFIVMACLDNSKIALKDMFIQYHLFRLTESKR